MTRLLLLISTQIASSLIRRIDPTFQAAELSEICKDQRAGQLALNITRRKQKKLTATTGIIRCRLGVAPNPLRVPCPTRTKPIPFVHLSLVPLPLLPNGRKTGWFDLGCKSRRLSHPIVGCPAPTCIKLCPCLRGQRRCARFRSRMRSARRIVYRRLVTTTQILHSRSRWQCIA